MVCPTGPGGFVFQWFAQRVWRGFRILFGFFSMVCPTGLEGFRFSMVCPRGPGGFVFQWFAQRVWRGFGFFFSMVCPTGLEGFRNSFSMVCPTGPGGFVFQWFAQRVAPGALRVGSAPAPRTLPGGHFWRDPAPAQVGYILAKRLAIQVLVERIQGLGRLRLLRCRAPDVGLVRGLSACWTHCWLVGRIVSAALLAQAATSCSWRSLFAGP